MFMTIKIEQSELASMLAVLAPYLSGCLSTGIRVKDKKLELFIHRVEQGSALARVSCKKTLDHDWMFINGSTLQELVKAIHEGSIEMSFTATGLTLRSPGSVSELRSEKLGFPLEAVEAVSIDSKSSAIKGKDLALLSVMTEAASTDETRPTLNGIYLAGESDGLKVAAADGFILAFTSIQAKELKVKDGVYSATALNRAKRAMKPEEDEDIAISFHNGGITLSVQREKASFSFQVPMINDSFVNYQPIIDGCRKEVVRRDSCSRHFWRAKAIDGHMYMQVVNGHLWMMAVSGDKQENKSIDSIAVTTKEQSVVMHYKESMLRDVLKACAANGHVTLNFPGNSHAPMLIESTASVIAMPLVNDLKTSPFIKLQPTLL
jgi:DNA polymerase III sliding clamp (beta) subunit (PCNA family)